LIFPLQERKTAAAATKKDFSIVKSLSKRKGKFLPFKTNAKESFDGYKKLEKAL